MNSIFGENRYLKAAHPSRQENWLVSRREFAGITLAAAAAGLPRKGTAHESVGWQGAYAATRLVVDERLPHARHLVTAPGYRAIDVNRFPGNVTELWQVHLRQFWSNPEAVLIGISRPDALFCLTMLARDQGHRLVLEDALAVGEIPSLTDAFHRLSSERCSLEPAHLPDRRNEEARFWIMMHRSKLGKGLA